MHLHSLPAPAFATRITEIYSKRRHISIPAATMSSNTNTSDSGVTFHSPPAGFECFARQCPFSQPRRALVDEPRSFKALEQNNTTPGGEVANAEVDSPPLRQREGGAHLQGEAKEAWWRCASYKSKRRRLFVSNDSIREEDGLRLRRSLRLDEGYTEEMIKEKKLARQARKQDKMQSGKKSGRDYGASSGSGSATRGERDSSSNRDRQSSSRSSDSSSSTEKGRGRKRSGDSSSSISSSTGSSGRGSGRGSSGGRDGRGGRVRTKGGRNATWPHANHAMPALPNDDFLYGASRTGSIEERLPLPPPPLPPPELEDSLLVLGNQEAWGSSVPKRPALERKSKQENVCH